VKFSNKSKIGGLITSRKVGETLIINNGELIIEVIEIAGNRVRIALKASKEISIRRGETSGPL
jgi:carbon storage regulator CsrA